MNPAAILALIGDLYAENARLQAENTRLKNELVEVRADTQTTAQAVGD